MSLISQKFRVIRKYFRYTQKEFADKASVSQRDISQIENGKKEFIHRNIIRFLLSENINLNWFFDDRLPALPDLDLPETEKNTQLAKTLFADQIRVSSAPVFVEQKLPVAIRGPIRVVSKEKVPTYPGHHQDKGFLSSLIAIMMPGERYRTLLHRAFEMVGDSMDPTIVSHNLVIGCLVKDWPENVKVGYVYIFVTVDDIIIARLNKINTIDLVLAPDNKQYKPFTIEQGKVLEVWKQQALIVDQPISNRNA